MIRMLQSKRRAAKPRRFFRFTLRTLLIAVTVLGVWLGWRVNRAHRQRDAVQTIRAHGGLVTYDYQFAAKRPVAKPSEPAWLIDFVGIDFFHKVEGVDLGGNNRRGEFNAQVVDCLNDLPHIRHVALRGNQACDETFSTLATLPNLESIDVEPHSASLEEKTFPPFTDAGVEQLTRVKTLKHLWFGEAALSDKSLGALGKMPNLETAYVYGSACSFTDAGLAKLAGLKNIKQLHVGTTDEGCEVTDRGLASLSKLKSLEFLGVRGRAITDRGLLQLTSLPKLSEMEIASEQITDAGIAEFCNRSKVGFHQTPYTSFAKTIRKQLIAAHTIDNDLLPAELSVSTLHDDRREFLVSNLADAYFKYEHRKRDEFKRRALADNALDSSQLESLLRELVGR